jgi:hypothetical protein
VELGDASGSLLLNVNSVYNGYSKPKNGRDILRGGLKRMNGEMFIYITATCWNGHKIRRMNNDEKEVLLGKMLIHYLLSKYYE